MKTRRSFFKLLPLIAVSPIVSSYSCENPLEKFGLFPKTVEYLDYKKICDRSSSYMFYNISILQPNCEPILLTRTAAPREWREWKDKKFIEDGWQVPVLIEILQSK